MVHEDEYNYIEHCVCICRFALGVLSRPRTFFASVFVCSVDELDIKEQDDDQSDMPLLGEEENLICDVNNDASERCAMAACRHRRGEIAPGEGKLPQEKAISGQRGMLRKQVCEPCRYMQRKCNCSSNHSLLSGLIPFDTLFTARSGQFKPQIYRLPVKMLKRRCRCLNCYL